MATPPVFIAFDVPRRSFTVWSVDLVGSLAESTAESGL
jgi:hypothetical protein